MSGNFSDTLNDIETCGVPSLNCSAEESMLPLNSETVPASAVMKLNKLHNEFRDHRISSHCSKWWQLHNLNIGGIGWER